MKNSGIMTKIIAVMAAVILWIFVMNEQNPLAERTITIPVVIKNLDADQRIVLNTLPSVQVRIRAPRLMLAGINDSDIKASIDLSDLSAGTHSVRVQLTLPPNIELLDTSPAAMQVVLDDLITQKLQVQVQTEGKLTDGFQLENITVNPTFVLATGPASERNQVSTAKVVLRLNDAKESFQVEATPIIGEGQNLSSHWFVSPATVQVTTEIAASVEKVVPVQIKTTGLLPIGFRVKKMSALPSEVLINGSDDSVRGIRVIRTEPISLENIKENTTEMVNLNFPPGIGSKQTSVTVSIEIDKVSISETSQQ